MGTVIQMHDTRAARSRGVALAVACTATRLGLTPAQVIRCAQIASDSVRRGEKSAWKAYADAKARIATLFPGTTA